MGVISEEQALAEQEQAQTTEIQEQTDDFQAAASKSLSEAREARQKVRQTQASRAAARAGRRRLNTILEPIMRDVSPEPVQFTAQKRDGRKSYGSYKPVTVEERGDQIIKTYKGTYLHDQDDRDYQKRVYDKRIEVYDKEGRLVSVKEWKTYRDDGEEEVYLRREKRYESGTLVWQRDQKKDADGWRFRRTEDYKTGQVKSKDYRQQAAASKPVYEVTTAEGKKYRSTNPDWIQERFGVDPRKQKDTFTLRESGSGKTYESRVVDVRGEKMVLGVRSVSKAEQEARVSMLAAPRAPSRTSTVESIPVLAMNQAIIENVIKGKEPPKAPPEARFEYGDNITVEPLHTTLPTLQQGNMMRAAPEREPAPKIMQMFGLGQTSEEYALEATRFRDVDMTKSGAAETKAAIRGGYEFFEPIADPLLRGQIKKVPAGAGEFLAAPFLMLANPKASGLEIQRSLQVNPTGTLTQLAIGVGLGKAAGKGIGKIQEVKATKAARSQLAKGLTEGEALLYDERGVATTKTGTQTVKVGKRTFQVTTAAEEAAGVLPDEALMPGRARGAALVAEAAAGERATLAGQGRISYQVLEKGTVKAEGTAATGLGAVDLGGVEVYARTAKGELVLTRGSSSRTIQTRAVEVGTLREEVMLRAGDRGRSVARGQSAVISEQGVAKKEVGIRSSDLYYEDLTRIQREEIRTRQIKSTPRGAEGPPNFIEETTEIRLTGGEARKVQRSQFETLDATNRQLAKPLPANPLEQTPEFAFRQLFGDEAPTTKRGRLDRALAGRGKKAPTAPDLLESPSMTKIDKIERGVFTSAKRKPQGFTTDEPVKAVTKPATKAPSVKATTTGKALQDELAAQAIGKIVKEETPKPPAPIIKQRSAREMLQAGKLSNASAEALQPKTPTKTQPKSKAAPRNAAKSSLELLPKASARLLDKTTAKGSTRSATRIRQDARPAAAEKLDEALKLDVKNKLTERLTEKLATRTTTKTATATTAKSAAAPPGLPPLLEPPALLTPPTLPLEEGGSPGFVALVRKKGRFERVTPKPLSKEAALLKGLRSADQTAAATVRLVKEGAAASTPEGSGYQLKKLLGKFRQAKSGDYIEKNIGRIDTLGEKKEITLKGIAASSHKGFGAKLLKGIKKLGGKR